MNLTNNLLSQTELELLHEESLKILENVGVAFFCEEAVEIFRKHGAHIEGETVFINEKMLRNALSTVPKSFEWFGRSSSVVIGNGNTVYAPAYGPMFVLEGEEYRYPTTQDFINFHKLDETSKVMSVGSPNIMDLPSVNASVRSDYAMAATLLYHEKPVLGIVDGKEKALNKMCIRDRVAVAHRPGNVGKHDDKNGDPDTLVFQNLHQRIFFATVLRAVQCFCFDLRFWQKDKRQNKEYSAGPAPKE